MIEFSVPPQKVEIVLLVMLVIAAIYDVRYRRIPNWLTVSGLVLGLAINAILPETGIVFSLVGFLLAFVIYAILFSLRAMGAGDVKLMAAVGALVGFHRWLGIFFVTALVGGIMAMILIIARRRLKKTFFNVGFIFSQMRIGKPAYIANEELDVRSKKAVGLPHGAVIAVGTVFYLAFALHLMK
jgi:prepilin peptidase CpaA